MITVKIGKHTEQYKPKPYFGMDARQVISAAIAIPAGICIYVFLSPYLDVMTIIVAVLVCGPIIAIGWINMLGMPFEKYFFEVFLVNQIAPKLRPYVTKPAYNIKEGNTIEKHQKNKPKR